MPSLLDVSEIKMDWSDANSRVRHPLPPPHPRTPGVHLSGVLRYIALEAGYLAKPGVESTSKVQDHDEDEMPLRMMLGMFFEEGVVGLYPDMHWQPGELGRDEVHGTMDGLSVMEDGSALIEEFKLTWKSERNYGGDRFLTANWLWMGQAKGYLALAQHNQLPVNGRVRFHVGWVNGDYRPPQPKLIRYLVEFKQREIDVLWGMVKANRDKPGVKREG